MKTLMVSAALLAAAWAGQAVAGPIERACMSSDQGNRQICNCIQQVADQTLYNKDQRLAAKFFKDPDRAQDVFLSKRQSDDEFWDRYKNFGAQAEAYCAPQETVTTSTAGQ
jgi:hypothetical protein